MKRLEESLIDADADSPRANLSRVPRFLKLNAS